MKSKLVLSAIAALVVLAANTSAAPDPSFYIYLCFGQLLPPHAGAEAK